MSDGASPLLAVVLLGGAFAGTFLFLLFMLWASGRNPLVRRAGELIASVLYLLGILAQAWNVRGSEEALYWSALAAAWALGAAINTHRFAKAYRDRAADASSGTAAP